MRLAWLATFALAVALLAASLGAEAQQKATPVIGVLNTGWPGPSSAPFMAAFRQGLTGAPSPRSCRCTGDPGISTRATARSLRQRLC
jgi:hypothetical protein